MLMVILDFIMNNFNSERKVSGFQVYSFIVLLWDHNTEKNSVIPGSMVGKEL